MNSLLTNKRRWFVGAFLALSLILALAPVGRIMADTNPFDPPIKVPTDPGTTPPDTTIAPDALTSTDSLTTWDILYALIIAL